MNYENRSPLLLSDLREELKEDWIGRLPEHMQSKVRDGEIDIIVGRYNELNEASEEY